MPTILFVDTVDMSCWRISIFQQSEAILSISVAFVRTTMTYHSPLVMVAIGLLGDEADRNQLEARRKPSAVGGLPTPSGVFHGLVRLPTIPHRECLIVSGPSKILLRNATSTLSISEIGAPVRRLRPKSRPFVVAPELAIPIFFGDRFPSIFHVISS